MADQWYIARNNKKHGPFTAAKLKELAEQGRLLPTDMLLKEGMQKWLAASSVKGLFPAAPARPAAAKPPAPNGGDFRFNAADSPKARRTQPSSRKRLLILGAAGGGVLLLVLIVTAAVLIGRGKPGQTANNADGIDDTPSTALARRTWGTGNKKGMAILCVAYSPDGKHIITLSADSIIRIWDADTGRQRSRLPGTGNHRFALSHDGNWIASFGAKTNLIGAKTLLIWNNREAKMHLTVPETRAGFTPFWEGVAFSPDSTQIATGYYDSRRSQHHLIRIRDVKSGEKVVDCVPAMVTFRGRNRPSLHRPISIAYSKDGNYLASCSDIILDEVHGTRNDGEVKIWNASTGSEERTISVSGTTANAIAFSPDGKHVAVGCGKVDPKSKSFVGCDIRVFDVKTGAEVATLHGHSVAIQSLTYNHDGTMLISGAENYGRRNTVPGEVIIWSMPEGKELRSLKGHSAGVHSVAFSPDGKFIVAASGRYIRHVGAKETFEDLGGEVKRWDAKTGEDLGTLAVEKGPDNSPTDTSPETDATDAPFDHAANTKAALKKKIIEISYVNAVQPVTKTYEAMCKPQKFKDVIGNPDRGDTSDGKNKLWTYSCSDGEITFRVHFFRNTLVQIVKIVRE